MARKKKAPVPADEPAPSPTPPAAPAAPVISVNTEPLPGQKENPELAGLRESEAAFVEKGKRLEAMDANEQSQGGVDIQQVKQANANALANVRKRIAKLSK